MRGLFKSVALGALAAATGARAQTAAPQDLVVTAQKPVVSHLIDRKVYAVSRDLQASSGSAADLLNNVPSVDVDADGNVSLRGDSNVTILVDGKPSAQFAGATRGLSLQQLSAADIDRVEVLTNPPAQYRAEGSAGVINIITKKTHKAGFSGSSQLNLGDQRRFVAALDGAYNTQKLRLSGGLGLRQDARERVTTTNRAAIDPTTNDLIDSQERIDEHSRRLVPSEKLNLDYDLTPAQTVGASFSHREQTGRRFFNQSDASEAATGGVNSLSDRHSDGFEWNLSADGGLHFEQKLARPGETLSLSLQRSATRERERYDYRDTSILPPAAAAFDDLHLSLDLVKTEFSADYDLPLADDRELKLGYDLEDDRNAFDNVGDTFSAPGAAPVIDPSLTNHFRYHQQVNAAYGQYQTPLGRWRAQAGLRVEATTVGFLQITGNLPGGHNLLAAYPSLSLDRDIGAAGKLSASLSRRVTRPDPEALNPFSDHQDTHNLRAGDPNLLPQDTWSYELGYNTTVKSQTLGPQSVGASLYYRFDRNSVTDVVRPVSADVVLATKANLPKTRAAGLDFNANGKLTRTLGYALSGNAFYSQIDAVPLGATGLKSTVGVNLKASLDYRPTPADTAQISISRTDRRLTPQGMIDAIDLVNLGYKRQVRPDLSVVVTVSDAFDGQRFRRLIDTPQLRDDYLRHQIGRIAYVGIVYTFGAAKKTKAAAFDYDQ